MLDALPINQLDTACGTATATGSLPQSLMGSAALLSRAGCSTHQSVGHGVQHRNGHGQHASVIDGFGSAAEPCWVERKKEYAMGVG